MDTQTQAPGAESDEFWLFGYGSLIWKPPPHFDRRIPGYVTGYVRRFWQVLDPLSSFMTKGRSINRRSSPGKTYEQSLDDFSRVTIQDHRGTPSAPGRVVTLIERSFWSQLTDHHASAPSRVWGVAYRIPPPYVAEVKDYLDIREINGYTIHHTPFHPSPSGPSFSTLVYIGTPDNDQFVGPQDPQALAEHIARSAGPSGPNPEYLFGLEAALAALGPESGDEHVTDLAERVRGVMAEKGGEVVQQQEFCGFQRAGSVDEQEETEKTGADAL